MDLKKKKKKSKKMADENDATSWVSEFILPQCYKNNFAFDGLCFEAFVSKRESIMCRLKC